MHSTSCTLCPRSVCTDMLTDGKQELKIAARNTDKYTHLKGFSMQAELVYHPVCYVQLSVTLVQAFATEFQGIPERTILL